MTITLETQELIDYIAKLKDWGRNRAVFLEDCLLSQRIHDPLALRRDSYWRSGMTPEQIKKGMELWEQEHPYPQFFPKL